VPEMTPVTMPVLVTADVLVTTKVAVPVATAVMVRTGFVAPVAVGDVHTGPAVEVVVGSSPASTPGTMTGLTQAPRAAVHRQAASASAILRPSIFVRFMTTLFLREPGRSRRQSRGG